MSNVRGAAADLWEIRSALDRYGIEIPFPQRDLHLRSVLGLKDEAARDWLGERGKATGDA